MTTLVLFHGWGASGQVWERQAAAFGPRLTVLTPTVPVWEAGWFADFLRGNAASRLPVGGLVPGGHAAPGGPEPPGGPAPGGLVLAGAAASFTRRPDYPWGQPPAVVRAMRRALTDNPQRVLAEFAGQCLAPGEAALLSQAREALASQAAPETLAAGLDYLLNRDLRPLLARLPAGSSRHPGAGGPDCAPGPGRVPSGTASRGPA